MSATIRVTSDQIDAARALIRIRGGEDKVDPVIARIAHADDNHSTTAGTAIDQKAS